MKKKVIPVIVAVFLIIIVAVIGVVLKQVGKYTPTKERADLDEYFEITSDQDVALIIQQEHSEYRGNLDHGQVYLNYEMVKEYFNDRFYWDQNENLLIYTTPTEIICSNIGTAEYFTYLSEQISQKDYVISKHENGQLYLAVDYVKEYTDIDYELFENPNHMVITYEWSKPFKYADIVKNNYVRYQGGIKSPILTDAAKDDRVIVIEEMEDWSEVLTKDGYIGYIQNKFLGNKREEKIEREFEAPVYKNTLKDYKINLAFHQVTNQEANASLTQAVANAAGVNTISPTWFSLSDIEGNISSIASAEYVQTAHGLGLEVWGLVDNFNKEISTKGVLSYTSKRSRLIQNLITEAMTYDLDGINIDFEEVSEDTGEDYIQFIRELSIPCRELGIVLSVDNYVPKNFNTHYHRKEQGIVADYFIIMGYDEHYKGSKEAGSVASIGFVKDGILGTLAEVPANKIINAMPLYTRVWKETPKTEEELAQEDAQNEYVPYKLTSDAVGMKVVQDLLAQNQIEPVWDETSGQYYAEFDREGVLIKVWIEDERSIAEKMKLAKENDLGGVAVWKLGFETPNIWTVIQEYLQ